MSSAVLDYVRARKPEFANVPDADLTLYLADRKPEFLEVPEFARNVEAFRQMRLNDADTAARTSLAGHVGAAVESGRENFVGAAQAVDRELIAPLTGGTVDQWASAVPEAASLMLRQPVREAGKVFSAAGRLLAEDVGNVTRLTGLDPAGPVAKGLQDVGETAPVLAASMGLQRLGLNPAVAFGAPPAVQTYGETGDVAATLKAGATGTLIPAVAQVGKLGGAALNRALIERNLLSPAANATQKAVEVLGSQGAVQVFMEGLRLPEYAALDPEARREAIYRNLVANTAFLAMDLPTFKRSVPSETLLRMAPAERVAYGLRDAANNPELVDALQRTADELARQATLPDAAQVEGEGPLFRREAPLGEVPASRQNTQAPPDSASTVAQQETQAVDSSRSATSVEITWGSQTSPTPAGNTSAPSATARLAAPRPIQEPWSDRWSVSLQVSNTDTGAFTNKRVRESLPPELRGSVFEVRRFDGEAVPTDRSLSTPGRIQITFANKAAAEAAIRWFSDPEARQQPVGRRMFPGPAADAPGRPLDPFPTDQGLGRKVEENTTEIRTSDDLADARIDGTIQEGQAGTLDNGAEWQARRTKSGRVTAQWTRTRRWTKDYGKTWNAGYAIGDVVPLDTPEAMAAVKIVTIEDDNGLDRSRPVEHYVKDVVYENDVVLGVRNAKSALSPAASDTVLAFGRRTVRPLDPFPTDQGAGETVAPDAEWNVVGMGRKAAQQEATKGTEAATKEAALTGEAGMTFPQWMNQGRIQTELSNTPDVAQPTFTKTVSFTTETINGPKKATAKEVLLPGYRGARLLVQEYKAPKGRPQERGYRVYFRDSGALIEDSNGVSSLNDTLKQAVNRISSTMRARGMDSSYQLVYSQIVERAKREARQPAHAKEQEATKGTEAVAQRMVNAEEGFLEFAMQTAGLTREQAVTALAEYRKAKAIKIDPVGGQFSFTHGGFAEAEVLRRAAGLEAKSPAASEGKQAAGAAKAEPAEGAPVSAGTGSSTPTPEATPKPVTRKPRQFRPRETVGDILDDIEAAGGLISKSEARNRKLLSAEKNGPEYDDAPSGLAHPTHNFIYGNGRGGKGSNTPDRLLKSLAAQNPKYAGMTVPEMWAAIKQASAGRVGNARNAVRERTQAAEMAREEVRAQKDFNRAIQKQGGDTEVAVDELAVGQEMVIAGERFEVESIDPDTGDVVLKDGPRFGRRVVEAGKVIYVENVEQVQASTDFAPVEQEGTEGTKAEAFRKVAREWSKTLPDADKDSQRGNNITSSPWDQPFVDGKLTADRYGEDPYVYEDRWIDPRTLLYNSEGMTYEQIVNMPTTQKYIEWYKQGHFGPPISVVFNAPEGRLKSSNRRRVVAAMEAGIERIPARVEIGKASEVMAERPSGNGPEGIQAPRSPLPAPGVLDAPESVADQRARQEREAAQAKAKADREKLEELQAKPLTGSVGDIGQGDLLGGGDLFSAPAPRGTAGSPRQPQGQFGLPAIPAGTATAVPSKRMVVTMERLVPGFTTVANIERRLSAIVDVARGIADASPIRSNRLSRRFAGVYTTPSRVIRMWDRLNLPTTAHEVAHALADAIFGTAASRGLRGIPPSVGRELVRLGRNLYGNTRPNLGYAAEGWAELLADYLTTDDIARRAPQATQWLENTVLPAFPEVARAMREARAEIDVWRGMGARERMRAQTAPHDSKLARLRTELSRYVGREGLVEQFAPFEALSRRFRQVAGRDLAADEDPFLIASARRGQAGSILAYMADEGMIDPSGNRTGGRSLREALAPVTRGLRPDQVLARNQRAADFWSYLWARRAIERWGLDRNPGISLADAQYLRQTLETPDFQLAASRYYQWWDGVLDYLAASSPANRELVARIRAGSKDYVPLARMLDPNQTRPGEEARLSNALRRMRGSSLPVRMLDVQTLLTAESLIARAHRDQVMEAVFRLANQPGMGAMIEEVPRSQVQEVVNIERLRAQLEGMGVDTTGIPADTLLEYYTGADAPGGSDPIVARRVNGEVRWYYVRPDLYAALEGIQPARLPLVADLLLGVPARLFRLGTTGLRPAFSLFTNPVRDIQTFLMQSTAGVNPLRRVAQYFGALGDIVRSGMPGADATPYRDLFDRLGIMSGQPLGGDIGYARREARGLFHGRVFKRVTAPVETLRELLSFSEATPRIAELRLRAQEMGWAPGQPLTPAQAIQLTLAAKRVTTDFSASGSYARLWSQAVPFLNASIQGTRGFLRAMRERPVQATLYGVSMFTLPALWTWWHNKDEEWYQALPWRERYLYWNVPDENGQVYQIPRPPEWNNAFAVIPEALMDAAYRDNPDAVKAAFGHIFATTNPFDLPVLARIAWEQARNRVDFFDRPIVPRAQVNLRPGEQVGPYTSWLATSLGKAFPETISPRRVDHLLRGVGGGTASDTLSAIEQMAGLKAGALRSEPSETPVVGRALRRGGQFSAVNRQLADLYDLHYYWQARARNKELAPELAAYARYVDDQIQMVKFGQRVAEQTEDLKARQSLYRDLTRQAESMLADAKRLKRLPAQQ